MEAPRSIGELETLVMKYVLRTCESGRQARGAIVGSVESVEEGEVEIEGVDNAVAGFPRGVEICILCRPGCLPYWPKQDTQIGVVSLCTKLASTASERCKPNAGFIMMK